MVSTLDFICWGSGHTDGSRAGGAVEAKPFLALGFRVLRNSG